MLAGLAVAGRSLGEDLLAAVTGLEAGTVRRGLRELAAARLLAEDTSGGGHRPRHALLGEAVAAGLLPGERAVLHERAARALAATGTRRWPRRWPGTGRPRAARPRSSRPGWRRPKPPSGCSATPQAAAHWQRAIELGQAQPDAAAAAGIDVPRLSVRAIDAFYRAGDSVRAGLVAEEAYRRFAGHPDPATAAVVCHRAAVFRAKDAPAAGLPLMEEALRLFEQAPPSFDHADALLDYATIFLLYAEERLQASRAALDRALEIAEAAGATALIPRTLSVIAVTRVRARAGRGGVRRPGAGVGTRPGRTGRPGGWCGWPGTKATRCSSSRSSSAPPTWRRAVLTTPGRPACSPGMWPAAWPPTQLRRCWPWGAPRRRRR